MSNRGPYEAPKDYAEVFVEFYEPTKWWVKAKGVPEQYVEDVAQDVLAKFMEKDGLTFYDPTKTFDTGVHTQRIPGARHRRATFTGYMRSFVFLYCLNYRDKIVKTLARESVMRLDAPLALGSSTTWADTLSIDDTNEVSIVGADCSAVLHKGVVALRTRDWEHKQSRRQPPPWSLETGFAMVAESLVRFGALDRSWVAEQMGLTLPQVAKMLRQMREVLAECGASDALAG